MTRRSFFSRASAAVAAIAAGVLGLKRTVKAPMSTVAVVGCDLAEDNWVVIKWTTFGDWGNAAKEEVSYYKRADIWGEVKG